MMQTGFREIEVYIGPFLEWQGMKLNKNQAIKLVSNGNNNTLKISAHIEKSITPITDTATLTIYNLREETRRALKRGLSVYIFAGYENQEKELVYHGGITNYVSDKMGPDIVTKILCYTAQASVIMAKSEVTYTDGVDVKDVVIELAQKFEGVTVDPINVNVKGKIGYSGFSFLGQTKDALNKLAKQYGFTWTINDDVFYAQTDGEYTPSNIILTVQNGLRKVSPRLTGPWANQEGVDISAMYQPNVAPWKNIRVVSELNPNLSDKYVCHNLQYDLSPKDNMWDMSLTDILAFKMME